MADSPISSAIQQQTGTSCESTPKRRRIVSHLSRAITTSAPVVELDEASFRRECETLGRLVRESYDPDLIVGIATGGEVVARQVQETFDPVPAVVSLSIQRPGTGWKKRLRLGRILSLAPAPLAAFLRRLEVRCRERFLRAAASRRTPQDRPAATVDDDDAAVIRSAERILVVDDTVDSGRTITEALTVLRDAGTSAEVRTAVLTSTFDDPPVVADYLLHERTLIRFPWSLDAAG
jgi:hypoxanthine phosphoribosyltransferase